MKARHPTEPDPLSRVLEVLPTIELTVRGSSMLPLLPPSSRIECRRPRDGESLLHRVVVARDGERRLAHRAIATWRDVTGERWVRMRGDNSAGCEDVARRSVIAVVDAMLIGGIRIPLHRVPAWLEGSTAWIGRQVVFLPRRIELARKHRAAE